MNRKKLQLDICKAMLDSNSRLSACLIDEKQIAVSINGFTAYAFYLSECIFNTSQINYSDNLKEVFKDNEKDELISFTGNMRIDKGYQLEEYANENLKVYIKSEFTKNLTHYKFYAYSPINRVLIKDEFERVVGVVAPIRVRDNE